MALVPALYFLFMLGAGRRIWRAAGGSVMDWMDDGILKLPEGQRYALPRCGLVLRDSVLPVLVDSVREDNQGTGLQVDHERIAQLGHGLNSGLLHANFFRHENHSPRTAEREGHYVLWIYALSVDDGVLVAVSANVGAGRGVLVARALRKLDAQLRF